MLTEIKYNEMAKELTEQLPKGAFLTVKDQDLLNTMIIGWGTIGYIWRRPILMVMVRFSRHTYELLEKSKEFTLSIPLKQDLRKAIAFCGSNSGADFNKFKECNLTVEPGKVIQTPVIVECDLFYECKVVYQQTMEPALLDGDIQKAMYSEGDFHMLYYGEILACYKK